MVAQEIPVMHLDRPVVYFDIENDNVRRDVLNAIPRTHRMYLDGRKGLVVPAPYAEQVANYLSQIDPLSFDTEPTKSAALPRLENEPLPDQFFDRAPTFVPESRSYEPGFRNLDVQEIRNSD